MADEALRLTKRVLVAEDNPSMALIMRFHLEQAGLQATVARTGAEAWNLVLQGSFDLVITDEQMPGLSGRELCQRMAACEHLAHLPVIMVTAKSYEIEQQTEAAKPRGVRQLLPKPFSPQELVAMAEECLGLSSTCA